MKVATGGLLAVGGAGLYCAGIADGGWLAVNHWAASHGGL